ncbi:MAG TPA: hypothetical protein VEV38_08415 [Candidatus Eremiobacteraceae bacterium]|nr:hypothetical protein [Candidatus Eremiobacteraceae bacterium]
MKADPLGVILGEALDKAIGAVVRSWPLVLLIWAVHAVAASFPVTSQGFGSSAVYYAVSPIEAFIGLRVLMPELTFAPGWIVRFMTASLAVIAVTVGLVGGIVASGTALAFPGVVTDPALPLLFGTVLLIVLVLATWLGVKYAFTAIITVYEGRGVVASFKRSWWLVSGSFRQTFVFLFAITLIVAILYGIPIWIGGAITTTYVHDAVAQAKWKAWLDVAFIPALVYGNIASYIAYARFLELLESRAEGRSKNPTNAPISAA